MRQSVYGIDAHNSVWVLYFIFVLESHGSILAGSPAKIGVGKRTLEKHLVLARICCALGIKQKLHLRFSSHDMGVNPKIGGNTPKMDGENHGKPYEQRDDLGCFPPIFGSTPIVKVP